MALRVQLVILASERFRGGHYTLVSFLFAHVALRVHLFVKVGARAQWFRTHSLEHVPSVMVRGQGI